MARTVRDANLETRTARLRLPIRPEPYWRGLEKGFALGYRRRGKGGTWLARRRPARRRLCRAPDRHHGRFAGR